MGQPVSILIVDDDGEMRKTMANCYRAEGYEVIEAETIDAARARLAERSYDLVTIDVFFSENGMQVDRGTDFAREVRAGSNCGIIMVSILSDATARNDLLSQVADDTIVKPFELDEMLARSRAVLRRSGAAAGDNGTSKRIVARFAGWTLNTLRAEVTSPAGQIVPLTTGEFHLLRIFAEHPNEVLSRERIVSMDPGSEGTSMPDRAVDMRISRLRSRLGDDNAELIRTIRVLGYRLVADVEWTDRE